MLFGASFTCMKTCGADYFVQTYVEGKEIEDVDWRRTATFAVFGFGYMGIAQYFLYVKLMAQTWFPRAASFAKKPIREKLKDKQGLKDLVSQVAIDQIAHIPFVFYPCYYLTKSMIMDRPVGHEADTAVQLAYNKWKTNFLDDVKTSWTIWIPCNFVNFGLMPMHLRVPFMAVCSFGFCVVLSVMRGEEKPELTDAAKAVGDRIHAETANASGKDIIESIRKAVKKAAVSRSETGETTEGDISFDEFKRLMKDCCGVVDDGLIHSIFEACDKDKSGGIILRRGSLRIYF
eukprot:g3603.t1